MKKSVVKESLTPYIEASTTSRTSTHSGEYLRAKINHANLKLDIKSKQIGPALIELRKIMEVLGPQEEQFEDLSTFELRTMLSEEFLNNEGAMEQIRQHLSMEQQYRIMKELMPATQEIDFINGRKALHVEASAIKQTVMNLLMPLDTGKVRHGLIHIKGMISKHERLMIIDRVHEHIPNAHLRGYQTNQDIDGKVLIEAMFFGDFEQEE